MFRAGLENLLSSAGFLVRAFSSAHDFLGSARVDSPAMSHLGCSLAAPERSAAPDPARGARRSVAHHLLDRGRRHTHDGPGDEGRRDGLFYEAVSPAEMLDAVGDALEQSREAHTRLGELRQLQRAHATLTARERAVMDAVIDGKLNKQIAHDFGTKEATVKEQRAKMMEKMQVSSVAELVRVASASELPERGHAGGRRRRRHSATHATAERR
jgi:FixJ family two-component response regulator